MRDAETRSDPVATPFAAARRVDGVDAARGLALVGMFVAHLAPDASAGTLEATLLSVADERPRLLFALAAGIGLGLLTGGERPTSQGDRGELRRQLTVRAVLLLLLGLLLMYILQPLVSVILDEYGIAFLLLLPLVFLPRPLLLGLGAGLLVIMPGLALALSATEPVRDARSGRTFLLVDWFLSGSYPVLVWVPVMLVGLAFARYGLRRPSTTAIAGLVGLAAVVAYLPGNALLDMGSGTLADAVGTSLVTFANVGAGLALTAALLAVTQWGTDATRRAASIALSPLSAMGSMPLTVYTAHVVVISQAIRIEDGVPEDDSWTLLALTILGSMAFALAWRRWVGRGPLEALFRWVSGRDRIRRRSEPGGMRTWEDSDGSETNGEPTR
ncbi:hypothetical protein ARHIZOSPH14_04350 [Agromyces rhizosphaerae]|uniref:DUF418 domain-containing protein n=1 Tax=Agromyces rhizosphaerae TaxID=88374 RepID=A0A9W6FQL5_9MICO|nr:heparan-alpha-glucosaminide N-acetyltransferase domain-containing protein [Agromyces rhizosphaerae]GLI26193.1 hypothetical protein ARHIZOSPH14_04350 [Agromyces rhizosphaerae]